MTRGIAGRPVVGDPQDDPDRGHHQSKDGSWLSDDAHDRNDRTAMAVLALTVEYRYLPIHQR